jgi:nicotinate dehydrogenase subunit A
LKKTPRPTDAEIAAALDRNLCRCGTHVRILRAIRRAAEGTS